MGKTLPKVLIGIATKNDERYLPRFLKSIGKLTYPKEKLRFVIIFGDSRDRTLQYLKEFAKKLKGVTKVEIYKEQSKWRPKGVSLKADLYEDIISVLEDEEFILFIDTDVLDMPVTLLEDLISLNKDIVAPYVYHENANTFFDSYIFRKDGLRFPFVNPPGEGTKELIELDSAGTCLLVKAEVAKASKLANPHHWLHFCYFAREKGYKIYGAPFIRIDHSDCRGEPPHLSFEQLVQLRRIDLRDCVRRGAFSLKDLERYEKIIGRRLH